MQRWKPCRCSSPKNEIWSNTWQRKNKIQHLNVQVADFIRNHKKAGTAIDDEVTEKLVIPFVLDADGIDDLLERLTDGGISITDKDGNPSSKYVVEAPNQKS